MINLKEVIARGTHLYYFPEDEASWVEKYPGQAVEKQTQALVQAQAAMDAIKQAGYVVFPRKLSDAMMNKGISVYNAMMDGDKEFSVNEYMQAQFDAMIEVLDEE